MEKDRLLERLKKDVRSLLIASKHGLSIKELEKDYRMLIGSPLPVRALDYNSAMAMLLDMPDVVTVHTKTDGTVVLHGVVNEETKSIADLVSKQKASCSSKRKTINKRRVCIHQTDLVRRGRIPPVLPASVKSDLRDLLSISPLLVSKLETAFYNRFGRSFQYTRYGFYSLIEVLRSVSDMVLMTQTRAGSMLMLRTPVVKSSITGSFSSALAKPNVHNPLANATSKQPCTATISNTQQFSGKPPTKDIPLQPASSYKPPTAPAFKPPTAFSTAPSSGPKALLSKPLTAPSYAPSTGPTIPSYKPPTAPSYAPSAGPTAHLSKPPTTLSSATSVGPSALSSKLYTAPSYAQSVGPTASSCKPYTEPSYAPSAGPTGPLSKPPTTPSSALFTGPTALDKLFMAAKAEYYARHQSFNGNDKENEDFKGGDCSMISKGLETSTSLLCPCPAPKTQNHNSNSSTHLELPIEVVPSKMTTDLKADHSETTVDCSLQELQEQLDKNLKLCLSQKRAGSVGPELRQEIKHIVQKYPEGLSISKLPILYKQYTGKDLPFRDLGFMSVLDLVGSLGDMLHFENTMDQQAMTLFDAEIKSKEKVIEPNFLHADILSSWSTSTEKREPLKPLMVKVSNAEENQMWKLLDIEGSGTVPDIPPDAVRKQKLHCLPRMSRGFMISVFVENVTSPSEFYIRGYGKGTSEKLEDMMLEMRRCYSHEFVSNRYKIPADFVLVGEVYTVCKPGDVWWYRVIVHSVINSEEVQVYYPDYGNVATVKRSWLRFLKACYMTLPAQALPASLAYMTPVQDHWPTEAIKVFQHFHIRGPVIGIAVQYMSDRLYLFLCDTSTDEDVYLHQLLIDRGFASMTQELGSCKIMKKCSSFVHYLVPSSEKPEDSFHEPSVSSENCTAELQKEQPQVQMKEETESEMPHLETVFTGEDVWDESCSFYGCTLTANCTVQPSSETKDVQHSVQSSHEKALDSKVKQDQQEGSILKKALDSKIEQEQKEGSVLKPITASVPNSDVAGLPSPIEEFYISLIKSRKSLQLSEAPNTAPSQRYLNDVNTAQKNYGCVLPVTSVEEPSKEEERLIVYQKSQPANESSPLMGFQRFQIPRRSTTLALGPSARLAFARP